MIDAKEYNNNLKKIFWRWKQQDLHKNKAFVEDGIIDLDKWGQKSIKKILFLLKEAYGEDYDWDLCKRIRNEWQGARGNMWITTAYWAYVLQKTTKREIPFFPDKDDSPSEFEDCNNFFLSSAIVNVKKSGGKPFSENDVLKKYTIQDKLFLKEQIELIDPDIIVCGSTFDYYKLLFENKPRKIGNTNFIYRHNGRLIIDFWHPGNQFPDIICYYALGHVYQRIIK